MLGRLLTAAALTAAAFSAQAQPTNTSPAPPFDYPRTVTTSPTQVLPLNQARRTLELCNPNPVGSTTNCAVCPQVSRLNSATIPCTIGGAGSISLPPSWCWGKSVTQGATLSTAWNAVCSASSGFTAIETE